MSGERVRGARREVRGERHRIDERRFLIVEHWVDLGVARQRSCEEPDLVDERRPHELPAAQLRVERAVGVRRSELRLQLEIDLVEFETRRCRTEQVAVAPELQQLRGEPSTALLEAEDAEKVARLRPRAAVPFQVLLLRRLEEGGAHRLEARLLLGRQRIGERANTRRGHPPERCEGIRGMMNEEGG